jgi:hypothetical protein
MNYSKAEVCELIRQRVDYYLHYADVGEDADKRNYRVCYNKIRSVGFDTIVKLEEGIDELVRGVELLDIRNPHSNV